MLEHAVRAQFSPSFLQTYDYRIATTRDMKGKLLACGSEDRVLVEFGDVDGMYRLKGMQEDRFTFKELLRAVDCPGVGASLFRREKDVEVWRDRGMIISCMCLF